MINSLFIDGYRGLCNFEMTGLSNVNLLVGKNNSGKTSVLEALYILSSNGDPSSLWQLCLRRGERLLDERDVRFNTEVEIDVAHLFTGHEVYIGKKFKISSANGLPTKSVLVAVDELPEREDVDSAPLLSDISTLPSPRLGLIFKTNSAPDKQVALSRRGGLTLDSLNFPPRRPSARSYRKALPVHYISTESLTGSELVRLWDNIQLTPNEDLVLRALRFVDPSVVQVRSTGASTLSRFGGSRTGFIIKRRNEKLPFPLGSLGDGAWRMLAMAIVIAQCENGVLLVDEIDTGLHFSVMSDMWSLIFSAAKEFNVQVFATTHSYDCVQSLATICRSEVDDISEVTIQRIEEKKRRAIPFSEAEIKIAAERQIEVR